ncbi:MAG: D-alanyl-D-alanine carboxypeptidase family protein [Clostridia bacterium]
MSKLHKYNNKIYTISNTFIYLFGITFFFIFLFDITSKVYSTGNIDTNNATNSNEIHTNDDLQLYSNASVAMDFDSGNVLFEKNGYSKVYPASTTKILTALLAIENLDLDKSIVVSNNAIQSTPYESSIMFLVPGEVISLKNVLYGLLLQSGNDAANVLAENISGNLNDFTKLMNKKLKEIGCNDTHFTNAHGFHDANHYTTPFDMAKLMRYAMQNEEFKKIVETKFIIIEPTNKTPKKREFKNTNKMFEKKYPKMYYEYTVGGKTGYTPQARGTFVGYAKKGDKTIISSVFDGSQNISQNEARFLDSITLFNYSFDNFTKQKVLDNSKYLFNIIDKKSCKKYTIQLTNDEYALEKAKSNEYTSYNLNVDFNKLEDENITPGDIVGDIEASIKGENINISNTYTVKFLSSSNYFDIHSLKKYLPLLYIYLLFIVIVICSALLYNYDKTTKEKNI